MSSLGSHTFALSASLIVLGCKDPDTGEGSTDGASTESSSGTGAGSSGHAALTSSGDAGSLDTEAGASSSGADDGSGSSSTGSSGSTGGLDTGTSDGDGSSGTSGGETPLEMDLAAGDAHTCALLDTGAVRCWGSGFNGRLGYGDQEIIGDDEDPAFAGDVSVGAVVVQVAAGGLHTCARLETGAVRCWGDGSFGQLGYANTDDIGDNEVPATVGDVDVGGPVVDVATGLWHTCAIRDTGGVRCWGNNDFGQLGYGHTDTIGDDEVPASSGDVDVGGTAIQLAAGDSHTCALLDDASVRCWGRGVYGVLGYGNTDTIGDDEPPSSAGAVDVGVDVEEIAAGGAHTCARSSTGGVRCWGLGFTGVLGYGTTNSVGSSDTPASAGDVDVGGTVVGIATGARHSCALLDTGAVRCWGTSSHGELGYGNTLSIGDDETPASAGDVDVGGNVVQVTAGHRRTCARLDTDAVRCWGWNVQGALGYGHSMDIGDDELPSSAGDVVLQ